MIRKLITIIENDTGRVKNPDFLEQVSNICSKDDQILVGCQSGVRSLNATEDLLNAGFKNVKNVGGGYAAWLKNGFSICIPKKEFEGSGSASCQASLSGSEEPHQASSPTTSTEDDEMA
ncbi:uncharacterized protein M6B38_365575 [Iris pallida]|uniref:Rhodanese domain-containing protein n=1 Tax=Iris pallida TaxID=29817 RepID=A0AAX6DGM6_IRIPA|nr:Uncharacterized protein M6B38_247950 [Iris pallida]KAJ6828132.1 uncharacterized protein M6B38_365575 [Iris pallida]